MYVDVMQQILNSTTKVYVDTKGSNNLLYLPFDKLMTQNRSQALQTLQSQTNPVETTNVSVESSSTVEANDSLRDIRTRQR